MEGPARQALEAMKEKIASRVTITERFCRTCENTGRTLIQERGQLYATTAPCPDCELGRPYLEAYNRDRMTRMFRRAAVPPRYATAKLDDISNVQIRDVAERVAQGTTSLFITGPVGRGKSHLAAAILNARLHAGIAGLFIEVPDLLAQLRACFDGKRNVEDVLESVLSIDALVLDDIGAERNTDWAVEQLYRVVNTRYNRLAQTIATSNVERRQLEAQIGERTVSRLRGMGECLTMGGPDRRLREAR